MPIHHLTFIVDDLEVATKFYVAALAPLGYVIVRDYPTAKGLGVNGKPDFWIKTGPGGVGGAHIAFVAPSKEAVDQFHAAAIKAGGTDNGPPGLRHYLPGYYAAFVHDSQSNNIEACYIDIQST